MESKPAEWTMRAPEALAAASCSPMTLAIQLGSPQRSRQSVPAATQAATSRSP